MIRGSEVVRELPPGTLVPREELEKARQRAAAARQDARRAVAKPPPSYPGSRPTSWLRYTPAGPMRPLRRARSHRVPNAKTQGLLTYSLVDILTKSAESTAALSYRELVQRLQANTPAGPGLADAARRGQGPGWIVLGTEQPFGLLCC